MRFNRVEVSGINTSELKVLKEKEKIELLKRYHKGDMQARDELVQGNLKLVLSIIQRFQNSREQSDDLFQIGCIGLIKAIDNFDIGHNVRFSTYAVPMIMGEIKRYLRDNNSIRVSRSVKDIAYKALMTKERMLQRMNHEPSNGEIALEMGVEELQVQRALEAMVDPVSLYEPIAGSDSDALLIMDQIKDNSNEDSWISSIIIKDAVKNLEEREKKIMSLRFLSGKTQIEVSREIGISQAQVSRIEKNAIENIKGQL